jgi:signal peptidase I
MSLNIDPPVAVAAPQPKTEELHRDSVREIVEMIAMVFLAFTLVRTFLVEQFVIPTGSMAPTLMGQHKDVLCAACKFPYQVNASREEQGQQVDSGDCPNCGFRMPLADLETFKGDRILVDKSAYEIAEPQRWDVPVFKFPGAAKHNYIKRLVGLPNETVVIEHGDVHTGPNPLPPNGQTTIERKPPSKVRALLQMVYDNDFVLTDWIKAGWPACWFAADEGREGNWTASEDYKSFSTTDDAGELVWLRYRRIVPGVETWRNFQAGGLTPRDLEEAQPHPVVDSYAYNSGVSGAFDPHRSLGQHWVGDLALECELSGPSGSAQPGNGLIVLQLIKGGRQFECHFDLTKNTVQLAIPGLETYQPQASVNLHGAAKHRILLANVDEQLLLWVDDLLIQFNAPTTYPSLANYQPTAQDLSPVGIGVQGAAVRVDHLRVLRDIYYIADHVDDRRSGPASEIGAAREEYPLGPDQFLMLGDNSPQSLDSRLWEGVDAAGNREHYVHRSLLLGKAFFICWPHSKVPPWAWTVEFWGLRFEFPFYPNFSRMGLVR